MGIKIKNLQTGEFEKFNIPALKGEKGEPGEIEPSEKVDYIGKQHSKLRDTMNANVDYIIKTAIGEFNYLDYEGQHITATNSIEGHARSAILSGSTKYRDEDGDIHDSFVQIPNEGNLYKGTRDFNTTYWEFGAGAKPLEPFELDPNFKQATLTSDYQHLTTPTSKQGFIFNDPNKTWTISAMFKGSQEGQTIGITLDAERLEYDKKPVINGQWTRITWTFQGSATLQKFRFENKSLQGTIKVAQVMVTETDHAIDWKPALQDGEYKSLELISCKMPVLTTVGKNLFDVRTVKKGYTLASTNGLEIEQPKRYSSDFIYVKGLTDITITNPNRTQNIWGYDENKQPIVKVTENGITGNFIISLPSNITYIRIPISTINQDVITDEIIQNNLVQVEAGRKISSYEPYKSNILSTPEEIVLREVGGVCDTYNPLTGEYVQRIGELTFDGSSDEAWAKDNDKKINTYVVRISLPNSRGKGGGHGIANIISAEYVSRDVSDVYNMDIEGIGINMRNELNLSISNSKLSTIDIEGIKQYLSQKPLTVQYELAEQIIKTVDLSDNHVYSYKDTTHYTCSSEEESLVPTLSVKVPTDTQLTIQEQKATTQTLLIKNMDLQQSIKEVQAMNLAFNTALYNSFNSIREEVEDIKKHVSTNENLEGSF